MASVAAPPARKAAATEADFQRAKRSPAPSSPCGFAPATARRERHRRDLVPFALDGQHPPGTRTRRGEQRRAAMYRSVPAIGYSPSALRRTRMTACRVVVCRQPAQVGVERCADQATHRSVPGRAAASANRTRCGCRLFPSVKGEAASWRSCSRRSCRQVALGLANSFEPRASGRRRRRERSLLGVGSARTGLPAFASA